MRTTARYGIAVLCLAVFAVAVLPATGAERTREVQGGDAASAAARSDPSTTFDHVQLTPVQVRNQIGGMLMDMLPEARPESNDDTGQGATVDDADVTAADLDDLADFAVQLPAVTSETAQLLAQPMVFNDRIDGLLDQLERFATDHSRERSNLATQWRELRTAFEAEGLGQATLSDGMLAGFVQAWANSAGR